MVFRSKNLGRWTKVFIGCILLLLVLALYKFLQIRKLIAFAESFPEASATVEIFVAQPQIWSETTNTVGEVLAPQAVALRNEVEGRVSAVGFAAGDAVKKDQMLLQLDASEEIAQLRSAQAEAELAQLALARYQKLIAQNLSSREQYDQARAQYAMATARSQALQAVIDKKTLTAPFDGSAGLHTLQRGQYLAADTVITQLVGSQKLLWVDFFLPQQQGNINVDTPVSISANGLLTTPLTGYVIASEPAVSSTSRNLKLRAAIDNPDGTLKPGMLVDVQIATAAPREVIAVPATAIQYNSTGTFVYVVSSAEKDTPAEKDQQRATLRNVTIGEEKNRNVIITDGLQSGETIAANGSYKLQDKMLVFVKSAEVKGTDIKGVSK
jgi:membrane fusion protein (multidrug efflux system)